MIRFQTPRLPAVEDIARHFAPAEEQRWYSNEGPCWHALVERLEDRLGGLHCVPVASGTLGLMVALRVLADDPRRRRVLMPSFTFAATAAAVVWAGLEPVFADVEPDGWHLASEALAEGLETHAGEVAVVLPCSTFGMAPAPELTAAWEALAGAHEIPVLVDSAAGFGTLSADGTPLGGQGDMEVFSFHATKPLAIGEGGLITTASAELAQRARRVANFGFEGGVVVGRPGLNAKLAEWPAATALAALERFDAVLARRRDAALSLVHELDAHGFATQAGGGSGAWQFVPVLAPDAEERTAVLARAGTRDIEVRTYYDVPLHEMPAFDGCTTVDGLPVTHDLAERALSLPLAVDQTAAERRAIADAAIGAA